jgi:hypothetical protein
MTNLDDAQKNEIKQMIYDTYKVDVTAIKNLSDVANKLQNEGVSVPGNLLLKGPVVADHNVEHPDTASAIYRAENKLTLATDNSVILRNITSKTNTIEMDVKSGSIVADGGIKVNGTVVGSAIYGNKLCAGLTCLDETTLKRLLPLAKHAGWAIGGTGLFTTLLYEGEYILYGDNTTRFNNGSNDKWDFIYINKGWKITIWPNGSNTETPLGTRSNTTDDIPIKWVVPTNSASLYRAEWVGY